MILTIEPMEYGRVIMLEIIVIKLISLTGSIQKLPTVKPEIKYNALRVISHALNETYLYYRDYDNGKQRDLGIEKQLSNYWAAAAIPLRHIDQDLAMTCEYKVEYWVNPENWSSEQIHEHSIALADLREKYRNMLAPIFPELYCCVSNQQSQPEGSALRN
jgi:hypothetical protein